MTAVEVVTADGVFLDEPTDVLRLDDGRNKGPSPFEFFADESDNPAPTAAPLSIDSMFASEVPYEAVALPTIRPSLLLLLFLIAALTAFVTVRACQAQGVSPVAIWHLVRG